VTQESLRANIGMVTQDTSLLHRSVRENILYGRPDASEAELTAGDPAGPGVEFIAAPGRPGRGHGDSTPASASAASSSAAGSASASPSPG
jgi:ATP-binding cassette subfamily B multidrug efflux pump